MLVQSSLSCRRGIGMMPCPRGHGRSSCSLALKDKDTHEALIAYWVTKRECFDYPEDRSMKIGKQKILKLRPDCNRNEIRAGPAHHSRHLRRRQLQQSSLSPTTTRTAALNPTTPAMVGRLRLIGHRLHLCWDTMTPRHFV